MKPVHVVVGAGQAGNWAAFGMRQAGFSGRIVLVGNERWHPYERPPLSKSMLTEAAPPPISYFHKDTDYRENEIELLLPTEVAGIDAKAARLRLGSGETLAYDRLLLATGGRARRLACPGGEHAYYLRHLDDAQRLRDALENAASVICIGAGVIGLEVAASARARGASVVVLEAGPLPMGRSLSPEGAAEIDRLHSNAGVDIRYGAAVESIIAWRNRFRVVLADGSELECDAVVAAVGMERNVELAREAGVACDGGILVDAHGQTDAEGIYAAGDVAAFYHPFYERVMRLESWANAQNHGLAVGRSMAGAPAAYADIPWFWSDQYGANIQVLGMASEARTTIIRSSPGSDTFTAVHLSADQKVIGMMVINNRSDIRAGRKLIIDRETVDVERLLDPSIPLAKISLNAVTKIGRNNPTI